MKLTNKFNLPKAFYDAVANDDYSAGDSDITVTQLKTPPRLLALQRKYGSEVTEDVAERGYALLGQAVHAIVERAGMNSEAMVEERFFMEVNGWKLSGQLDHFEGGVLTDFKVTSAYVVKGHLSGEKDEWHCQLNTLAELLRHNGHEVEKLQVIAILRDWSKLEARREASFAAQNNFTPNYPQHQIQVVEIPLWDRIQAEVWINERVEAHRLAQESGRATCTDEDRWKKPDKWAVMKKGNKRAVKLFDSIEDLARWGREQFGGPDQDDIEPIWPSNLYTEHRPGTPTRCESYCSVAPFCTQYQGELNA